MLITGQFAECLYRACIAVLVTGIERRPACFRAVFADDKCHRQFNGHWFGDFPRIEMKRLYLCMASCLSDRQPSFPHGGPCPFSFPCYAPIIPRRRPPFFFWENWMPLRFLTSPTAFMALDLIREGIKLYRFPYGFLYRHGFHNPCFMPLGYRQSPKHSRRRPLGGRRGLCVVRERKRTNCYR